MRAISIRKPSISIRLTVSLAIVIPLTAGIGVAGWLSFYNGQKAVDELASKLMSEVSNRTRQHLDTYLTRPQQINEINLDAIQLGMLNVQDFQNTGRYFWKQMQVFDVGYISYGNAEGEFIGVERLDNGGILINEVSNKSGKGKLNIYGTNKQGNRTKLLQTKDNDSRLEAWYADPVRTGKPMWTQIYQWQDKPEVMSISASYPVYNNNRIVGVLSVDYILSQVSDFLHTIKISKSGKTFILERSGQLVASSTTEKAFTIVNGKAKRLNASDSKDASIRLTTQYLIKRFGNLNQIHGTQQLKFRLPSSDQFVQVTSWQDKFGLDWLIVVVVPESDFMGRIHDNTSTTVLLELTALVLAALLGLVLGRWLVQPILRLNSAARQIETKELNPASIEDLARRSDELGELARVFKDMALVINHREQSLAEQMQELQLKVEESKNLRQTAKGRALAELKALQKKAKLIREAGYSKLNLPDLLNRNNYNNGAKPHQH